LVVGRFTQASSLGYNIVGFQPEDCGGATSFHDLMAMESILLNSPSTLPVLIQFPRTERQLIGGIEDRFLKKGVGHGQTLFPRRLVLC
jgi:hypothetical protein